MKALFYTAAERLSQPGAESICLDTSPLVSYFRLYPNGVIVIKIPVFGFITALPFCEAFPYNPGCSSFKVWAASFFVKGIFPEPCQKVFSPGHGPGETIKLIIDGVFKEWELKVSMSLQ